MKIILEGPDNAGKTTLANRLWEICGATVLEYHHPGGRPADLNAEVACLQEQTSLTTRPGSMLLDRCTAISQQVYSPDEEQNIVRRAWLADAIKAGVLFVYCRPDTDWLMSFENFTWREGETEEFKQEIISKQHVFIERYDHIMRSIPHIHYDYRSDTAHPIIKHIALAVEGNQTSLQLLKAMKTFEAPKCI